MQKGGDAGPLLVSMETNPIDSVAGKHEPVILDGYFGPGRRANPYEIYLYPFPHYFIQVK